MIENTEGRNFGYGYLHLDRPDNAINTLFDNELNDYKRGFTMGMFGSNVVKTGGGKTVAASAIALDYDETFNVDRVVFSPAGLLKSLAEIEEKRIKGAFVICEEAQNYASNRTWFSLFNKAIMHTIATFRVMRAAAIFVTPMARMIDTDVQKLMRFAATSRLVIEGDELNGYIKLYEVTTANYDKDLWRRKIRFYVPETEQIVRADEFRVYLPPAEFLKDLENKVTEYKSQYRADILAEAEAFAESEKNFERRIPKAENHRLLAERLLEDKSVIKELSGSGKVSTGTIAAFFPNLKNMRDVAGVKWWVKESWEKLNLGKKSKTEFKEGLI